MAPQPLVPLFPPPPSLKFKSDAKLQAGVKTAIDEFTKATGTPPAFRIAIIDLADEKPGNTLGYGAHNGDTVDFIASEAKLIALYAAFALRDLVDRFNTALAFQALLRQGAQALGFGKAAPMPDLFTVLPAQMDAPILAAASGALGGLPRSELLPKYRDIFEKPAGGRPDFKADFRNQLQRMIVPSNNTAASNVIMSVGYAYISGAMQQAQLFSGGKGPWLSADFAQHYHPLIRSVNDDMVGQAGTALSMAQLMAILITGGVAIRPDSFPEMRKLMEDAVTGIDTPLLTRDAKDGFTDPADTDPRKSRLRIRRTSELTHIKLGQDWLKPENGRLMVWSEASRIKDLQKKGKTYAISYQNLLTAKVDPANMAFVLRRAIAEYEA